MLNKVVLCAGILAAAIPASAQTKITGTLTCAKPDVNQVVQIGDRPGHMIGVNQGKCTYSKPFEIEGVAAKDDVGSGMVDVRNGASQDKGYDVTTMANGDKAFVSNSGTSKMKGEALDSGSGKWSFTGGTGKFRGLKGGGTYKLSGNPDGTYTVEIEGQYTLAAAAPAKK